MDITQRTEVSIIQIRYITPADDRMAISKIYEESWKYAYKGVIPQEYLDSIPEGCWVANLDIIGRETLVCIDNEKMVGTCSYSKSRSEQLHGWGEVISIYLLPDYIGKGYGKTLMESAILELKKQGYEDVFLWCLEKNIRARHFYEHFGFTLSDDFLDDNIGGENLREVRYIYRRK